MHAFLQSADDVLRGAAWTTRSAEVRPALVRLLACFVAFAFFYGAMMGLFRGLTGQEQWLRQMAYSAIKVPLLLSGAFVIGLPSFFVLSTLLGLRRDFAESVRALIASQAGLTIVLASLSPLTLLWYASSTNYPQALAFNGLMFATASLAAQYLLRGYYRPLIRRNKRHRLLLVCWAAIYILVAIQLAWLLRPFIGSPDVDVTFLRENPWDNAYVVIWGLVWRVVGG